MPAFVGSPSIPGRAWSVVSRGGVLFNLHRSCSDMAKPNSASCTQQLLDPRAINYLINFIQSVRGQVRLSVLAPRRDRFSPGGALKKA